MRFSERYGYSSPRSVAQREELDVPTRNGIWSALVVFCFAEADGTHLYNVPTAERFFQALWLDFYKLALDTVPDWGPKATKQVRDAFFNAEWYGALDLVEFVCERHPRGEAIRNAVNEILNRELSAYRFVNGRLIEITSEEEVQEIEAAVEAAPPGAKIHLQQAVSLLADRANPDYRNSIKESISAVEGTLNDLAGTTNLSLGDALKKLDLDLHGAFRAALGNLYGYTSDSDGIRHSLMEEPNLDYADAKFMLVTCSAFVNYALAKAK